MKSLNLKIWVKNITVALKDILNPVDYGSQFVSNYTGSVCHIYKIGKLVFFQYGANWNGFAAQSCYTLGTLPASLRPTYDQVAVGQIHGNAKTFISPLTIYFSTNGTTTAGTGSWIAAQSGYPWFSCWYVL